MFRNIYNYTGGYARVILCDALYPNDWPKKVYRISLNVMRYLRNFSAFNYVCRNKGLVNDIVLYYFTHLRRSHSR